MSPPSTAVPLPVLVNPNPVPEMTPVKFSEVPATLKVLLEPKEMVPDRLLLPVDAERVPPLRVTDSAPTVAPRKSSVAPLATVTPPAVVPKPVEVLSASVPALTVVAPV